MRKAIFSLAAVVALALGAPGSRAADLNFMTGWLAECTAVSAGACTENTASGYARQPISFSAPVSGKTVNRIPYYFGSTSLGSIAGYGLYDAATGGNLIAVIPLATALTAADHGDVGTIGLTVIGMTSILDPGGYSANFAAAATLGTSFDGSTVTAGVADAISRGVLAPILPLIDPSYSRQVPLTGFAITPGDRVSTLVLAPAGTLATGTVHMPANPTDGEKFELYCGATVTALTVDAPSNGQAILGTITTCTASAGHRWHYVGGTTKTWYLMQ